MAETSLLEKVKSMLGVTGTYQDQTFQFHIDEVKQYLLDGGVSQETVEAPTSAGIIARGVCDLWNYGAGAGTLSNYFRERAIQLAIKSKDETGGNTPAGGTTDYNDLDNKPQVEGVELIGNKTLDEIGAQHKFAEVLDDAVAVENPVLAPKIITNEVEADNLYTNKEIDGTFVKQEAGKGLSENDFTDEYKKMIDDLAYVKIAFTAGSVTHATNEIGSTITEFSVTWTLNKTPKSQKIKFGSEPEEILTPDARSKNYSGKNVSSNMTIVITATDERDASVSRTLTINFQPKVYWGVAAGKEAYTDEDLLGLSGNALASGKARTFTVNAGADQYILYAIPSSFGVPTFKVNGFEGGFVKANTFEHTNASGYSQNYDVWKSVNPNLGNTQVVVT